MGCYSCFSLRPCVKDLPRALTDSKKESKNDRRFKEIIEIANTKNDNPHVKVIAGKKLDNQEVAVLWLNSLFEPILLKLSMSLLTNKKYNEYLFI